METKPLTAEAIALTEKKMDMTLDDIIKMSKKNTSKGRRPLRMPVRKAVTSVQRKASDGSLAGKKDKVATEQKPETMDALFADMKKQRMRMITQQPKQSNGDQTAQRRNISHHHRGRGGARRGSSQWSGNFHK
ncbi:hypothetical protein B296_00015632 [Ensete ventricosum]|uniref:Uncharacterized protein n=1 Tax=Ensete ventricosum TaxID=4639 RepID=A0A427B631_ENSVE|nr:hypothetical protein B296_00015632 [Ensete ventricosum]